MNPTDLLQGAAPLADLMPDGSVYTVSSLTEQIRSSLEGQFRDIWVEAEIGNFKRAGSGHLYFTLKDEKASLRAVMWRSAAAQLRVELEGGMKVLAHGSVTVYEPRGDYQLTVRKIQPVGIGELQLAFEQLRARLEEEGLFDAVHKKDLPYLPRTIGVVTSPSGAAIRDILKVLQRRYPGINVILAPVRVQGDTAGAEVARAVGQLDARDDIDVMIVGRGGGSLEDLWAFNEEAVARAIFRCRVPVIAAVGHEVDFSIADFVADVRAATPSHAAELVVPEKDALHDHVDDLARRMAASLQRRYEVAAQRFDHVMQRALFRKPVEVIADRRERMAILGRRMSLSLRRRFELARSRVTAALNRLEPLSPMGTLERGYALVTREGEKAPLRSPVGLAEGDMLTIRLAGGELRASVVAGPDAAPRRPRRQRRTSPSGVPRDDPQGTLFDTQEGDS